MADVLAPIFASPLVARAGDLLTAKSFEPDSPAHRNLKVRDRTLAGTPALIDAEWGTPADAVILGLLADVERLEAMAKRFSTAPGATLGTLLSGARPADRETAYTLVSAASAFAAIRRDSIKAIAELERQVKAGQLDSFSARQVADHHVFHFEQAYGVENVQQSRALEAARAALENACGEWAR